MSERHKPITNVLEIRRQFSDRIIRSCERDNGRKICEPEAKGTRRALIKRCKVKNGEGEAKRYK